MEKTQEIKIKNCDSFDYAVEEAKGYSLWTAAIFMVSFNAGLGALALPSAIAGTGWYGFFLILLATVDSTYSAIVLAKTWVSMENNWEEYRGRFRYPYPAMGMRTVGNWMRYVVTVALHMSSVGIAVVYLLITAQIVQSMTETVWPIDYKYWIIILAAAVCPFTWFGSIEEFKFAGIGALVTMILAVALLVAAIFSSADKTQTPKFKNPTIGSISLSFGTILYAYGGIFLYPTVQNDMRDKSQCKHAVLLSFAGLLLLYVPVAVVGYLVFGSDVASNVLMSLRKDSLKTYVDICLAVHTFLAFLLDINPVMQEVEEALHVPKNFNYKRCFVRTIVVGIVFLIAYTIPHFDKVLNLVGGSSMTFLTFICPAIFYFLIQGKSKEQKDHKKLSIIEKTFLLQIVVVGIAGGLACTYFAMTDIIQTFQNDYHTTVVNKTLSYNYTIS